jgi:hypothetical protein
MEYNKINLWTTSIHVIDNFIDSSELYQNIVNESVIDRTIEGQNEYNLSDPQALLFKHSEAAVINYCIENDIDYNNLEINDIQKGCLYKYDKNMVGNHLYEPHHDIGERGYITAIYYIDSSYKEDTWVGGELAIYKQLTFADYPDNCINILPKQNRLIIFPGYMIHRVKPYFGNKPRTSMVFGWSVKDGLIKDPITI